MAKTRAKLKPTDGAPAIRCIVHVTREYLGLAGVGGMKDVAEGLARASAAAGIETHVFLPYYYTVDAAIGKLNEKRAKPLEPEETASFKVAMNYVGERRDETVAVRSLAFAPKLTVHLIDSERYKRLFEGHGRIPRTGIYVYTKDDAKALGRPDLEGKGYVDYFALNILLVKATLHFLGLKGIQPDVIHCHDGHTATLPLLAQESADGFAAFLRHTSSLITIHNAGRGFHQEVADLEFARAICGIPAPMADVIMGCRLEGSFDPLLAGGLYGSAVNTVSENYARELQHTGQDSMTAWLGHVFTERGIILHGITNGVDPETWNAEMPGLLPLDATFSVRGGDLAGKQTCKRTFVESLSRGITPVSDTSRISLHGSIEYRDNVPLITFVGRLDRQKGFDMIAEALPLLFAEDPDVQLVGLGSGDPNIETSLKDLARSFPGRVCIVVGYNEDCAAKVYAAGDFFLIPSRFEPCGLTDFFAQLLGNLPIVHRVGGLVKTLDGRFGYSYLGGGAELLSAIRRALRDYREPGRPKILDMQRAAVDNIYENFTWGKILEKKYLALYELARQHMKPALPY
jgi:starch synthase